MNKHTRREEKQKSHKHSGEGYYIFPQGRKERVCIISRGSSIKQETKKAITRLACKARREKNDRQESGELSNREIE